MLVNVTPHDIMVTVGNDSNLQVKSRGTYYGHTIDHDGNKINIKLQDVLYVPELTVNLFSLTKAVSQPEVSFVGSDQEFHLHTKDQSFSFEKQPQTWKWKALCSRFLLNLAALSIALLLP